jgi:phosphoribosylformylglycinamidine cyclo-ligase
MTTAENFSTTYRSVGIDDGAAATGLSYLEERIRTTWPGEENPNRVLLDLQKFANIIDLGGGTGLALCTDGVGSKALIAQMMGKYDTIGIDCVAMCVNDLICVGATPVSMLDYVAVESIEPKFLDEIAKGLVEGAALAGVSITGGETAQIADMIKGHASGQGFDLVGMAVGTVKTDRIVVGKDVQDGDVVIGVEASGVHSNGLTLARHAFFETHGLSVDSWLPGLDRSIGEELLEPTYIYVREALDLLDNVNSLKALVHITSDGFLNLARVEADVGFVLDSLPVVPAIFKLIQQEGSVPVEDMFSVYNLGIGLCVVVDPKDVNATVDILNRHGRVASRIGTADASIPNRVEIRNCDFAEQDLIGEHKKFRRA